MKTVRFAAAVMLCVMLVCCSGCASILQREFVRSSKHVEDIGEDLHSAVLVVNTREQLKEKIISTIRTGRRELFIRLKAYGGDVDVKSVMDEISATPIYLYAVQNIAYNQTKILTYYELVFNINYKLPLDRISSIIRIENAERLSAVLNNSVRTAFSSLAVELYNYSQEEYPISQMYYDVYYSLPQHAAGLEELTVTLYPDEGEKERIIEINVDYTDTADELYRKGMSGKIEVYRITDMLKDEPSDERKLLATHDILCGRCTVDTAEEETLSDKSRSHPKTDPYTAYGALVKGKAVSEGYALAFKWICDEQGIECSVVRGELNGVPHMWNLVSVGGKSYHIDCALDDLDSGESGYRFFGSEDADMVSTHTWDREKYQAADGSALRAVIPQEYVLASLKSRLDVQRTNP